MTNSKQQPTDLIAKFAVGIEAVDDGIGEVQILAPALNLFIVRINAGTLPDGRGEAQFTNAPQAFAFALEVVGDICSDHLGAYE